MGANIGNCYSYRSGYYWIKQSRTLKSHDLCCLTWRINEVHNYLFENDIRCSIWITISSRSSSTCLFLLLPTASLVVVCDLIPSNKYMYFPSVISHATPSHKRTLLWDDASDKTNICYLIWNVSQWTHLGLMYVCPWVTPNHISCKNSSSSCLGILSIILTVISINPYHSVNVASLISLLLGSPEALHGSYMSAKGWSSLIFIISLPLGSHHFHIARVISM